MIKPIIGRMGGKWRISKWIIEHIKRFEWSLYVEPFCGSSAIYFQLLNNGIPELIKSRGHHPRFVLNDMDSKIINLYRCCRDYPELLAYAVHFTPYSREEHKLAQKGEAVENLIEMCDRFLVDGWQSFKGQVGDSWGFQYQVTGTKNLAHNFNKLPTKILTASKHLGEQFNELKEGIKSIQDEKLREQSEQALNAILAQTQKTLETDIKIEFVRRFLFNNYCTAENKKQTGTAFRYSKFNEGKALRVSGCNDECVRWSKLTFTINTASPHFQEISDLKKVYLENDDFEKVCRRWDTPYSLHYLDPPYYGKEKYYSEKFTKEDHVRLCQMVHELEGQVIVSYYPHSDILEMYSENDWEIHYKETVASSAGITRNSKTKTRPKRTEMLLIRKNKNTEKKINLNGQLNLWE